MWILVVLIFIFLVLVLNNCNEPFINQKGIQCLGLGKKEIDELLDIILKGGKDEEIISFLKRKGVSNDLIIKCAFDFGYIQEDLVSQTILKISIASDSQCFGASKMRSCYFVGQNELSFGYDR